MGSLGCLSCESYKIVRWKFTEMYGQIAIMKLHRGTAKGVVWERKGRKGAEKWHFWK